MRDNVPSTRYSSVCNVLRQWNIPLIPTYRVYRLYDITFQFVFFVACIIITTRTRRNEHVRREAGIIMKRQAN